MRRHLLAIAVILTAATGCDNVAWGGVVVEWRPPPSAPVDTLGEAVIAPAEVTPPVAGPVLLAGLRDGARATLVVVGEVRGDAIAVFPDPSSPEHDDRLAALRSVGSEWILFSDGARVGRLRADASDRVEDYCPSRVTISGVVELIPAASTVERLLALPASDAEGRAYGEYRAIAHNYDQRVATLSLAGEAIPRLGAPYPPGGLLAARQDVQAFQLLGTAGESVAATFMYRDQLAVGQPAPGAYALFLMGGRAGESYGESYVWYRDVATEGKGAPSYFTHLDWNDDGQSEILLDVLGSSRRWYAALARRGGQWVRTFQDTCRSGSAQEG